MNNDERLEQTTQSGWRRLLDIIRTLRGPDGCPWDREQTRHSMLSGLMEETHELMEAILYGGDEETCEELGDVLMIVLLIAQIASEEGSFTIAEVLEGISRKLVRRHPHVFGSVQVTDSAEVVRNWNRIKSGEKQRTPASETGRLVPPPKSPALTAATHVQKQAAKVGFDWADEEGILAKIHEETAEMEEALHSGDSDKLEEELGDLLFAVVNLARFRHLSAELLLHAAVKKFISRFSFIREQAGDRLEAMSLQDMDVLWEQSKKRERRGD